MKKLLLADDSITIQKVIQITFAHEDYQLTITDNGDTALARAREELPDLVLADVYMPGRNGYELCAAIKQTPGLQHVPVLLLAGSFEPFDEGKAKAAGADAWIEKPFESQALIDKVASLLAAAPAVMSVADSAVATVAAIPEPAAPAHDPFADISFEEPVVPAGAAPDDWSDLNEMTPATATAPARPAAEPPFASSPAAEPVFEFSDDAFAEPEPPPAVASDFALFDEGEEIMSLGDDDILAAEDLEPLGEVPTLTPWARDELPAEELFEAFSDVEPPLQAPVVAPPPEPVPAPAEPVLPLPVVPATTPVATEFPEPAAVEQRVATLSEAEIEAIVERAVGKVIEKLAGTVLERVAWEVVPDLAEALIKEEIRKIKDAAA